MHPKSVSATFRRFRHDLASLTVVEVHEGGEFAVVTLNEQCHLGEGSD